MEPLIRFSSYELDQAAGELRKSGVRVPLAGQPLDVLALLASRPGEVVTREELKEALWPEGTFIDFDDGLNAAVRRIRRALDDSATEPCFIETLPKRGYRFIGEVAPQPSVTRNATKPAPRRIVWLALATMVLALAATAYWRGRPPSETTLRTPSPPRNLTALPGIERDPTFSPDGSQFAFAWDGDGGDFDIYVRSVSGGSPVNLTAHHPGDDIAPAWSPDGKQIAFWRQDGQQSGIFLASPLGGRESRLTENYPEITERGRHGWTTIQLSWSPHGLLAFSTHTVSDGGATGRRSAGITVTSLSGDERLLTTGEDYHPAFSPDGNRIAFIRLYSLFTVDVSAGEASLEGPIGPPLRSYSSGLRWLAGEGRFLVSASTRGIQVTDATKPDATRVLAAGLPVNPAYSPRAALLAFAERISDHNIWRVDLENGVAKAGQSPRKLFASTSTEIIPRLSRDGKRIAFQSRRNRGVTHAYIADVDGHNLMEHPKTGPDPLEGFGGSLRWSPDGRWIVFDTNLQLALNSSNGGGVQLLTSGRGSGHSPAWSPDGRWIYYLVGQNPLTGFDPPMEIWRMPFVDGNAGEPELMVEQGGLPNLIGSDLFFLRPLPGGDPAHLAIWQAFTDEPSSARPIGPAVIDVTTRCWAVSDSAIFFADAVEAEATGEWWIKRLDPATGITTKAVQMHRPPGYTNGIEVARDESFLLYVVDDSHEQDLMIIEGFE